MNWKAVGYCTITCQTHSRNCVKIGETSRLSPARWPLLGRREAGEEEEGGGGIERERQKKRRERYMYIYK